MDDGLNGEFTLIFNGKNLPFATNYTVRNLTTGLPYRFKVTSQNVNGNSGYSAISTIYACLQPSNMQQPFKVKTTRTSVTIGWNEP